MDKLIANVSAVTMDEQEPVLQNAYIHIKGGKIAYIGQERPQGAFEEIDGRGKVAMPGLVNAHAHLGMSLMRGYADDLRLQEWLFQKVFPIEAKMDDRCVYAGTLLGIADCLCHGVTSVSDMYLSLAAQSRAALESGIKANLSNAPLCFEPESYDFDTAKETREMRAALESWHMADNGRLKLDGSLHAEYTSFPALWRANADFAARHGLNMHLHLSETQVEHDDCLKKYHKTPAALFLENGVFDLRVNAAHCVFVTDDDMDILAAHGAAMAHNPVSNLKLGSGVARAAAARQKGVTVALGTDGVCANNSFDLFEEIKLAAILQKGMLRDAAVFPARDALKMATAAGAYAQGRENECGMLKQGFDADIVLIDLQFPQHLPVHNLESLLCYSVSGRDVCMTMVRGKVLYENGKFHTIDSEKLRHELTRYVMPRLFGAYQ